MNAKMEVMIFVWRVYNNNNLDVICLAIYYIIIF